MQLQTLDDWMIRRLQKLGANIVDLLCVYFKHIRSILELAVPVWNASRTVSGEHITQLERIQKTALHIILGEEYKCALEMSGLDKLTERRGKIYLTFAMRAVKHSKFSNWFKQNVLKFCTVYSKTERFISNFTELLNIHFEKKKNWSDLLNVDCDSEL